MIFFGKNKTKRTFLDYASTTPVDKNVLKSMNDASLVFANPSALYSEALKAKDLVNEARSKIAGILNCQKNELFFTSSGTEANNLAILGVFDAFKTENFKPHIIVSKIEHPSVLEVCREIEKRGGEVSYLSVSEEGLVSLGELKNLIKENTILVSVMYANNEIGTVQRVHEIGRIIKEVKNKTNKEFPYFHTDASQASLYSSLNISKIGADLLVLDGIKMYGPRGSGLLFVKNGTKINPVIFGGGQEKGLRSGTENLPAIVGLAKALEIAEENREKEPQRLTLIRDYAIENILKIFPNATLNGSKEERLPNNINICFPGLDAEFAVISLDVLGISVSYSSSCRTLKEDSSSYVIESLGKAECKESSLRITLGRESTQSHIDILIEGLKKVVK